VSGIHRDEKKVIEAIDKTVNQSKELMGELQDFLTYKAKEKGLGRVAVIMTIHSFNQFHKGVYPTDYAAVDKIWALTKTKMAESGTFNDQEAAILGLEKLPEDQVEAPVEGKAPVPIKKGKKKKDVQVRS
jgi:hypothetical protein